MRRSLAGIALVSAAVVAYEVALTRIFSFRIWHHFAFMVLSVALLGTATSGVLLQRWRALGQSPARRAATYARGFALSAVGVAFIVGTLSFDPTQLATLARPWVVIVVYYLALAVPFTFAGLAIVVTLNARPEHVGKLYAADLVGAGLGAAGGVFALAVVGADGLVWIIAALALLGGSLLGRDKSMGWLVGAAAFFLVGIVRPKTLPVYPGTSKALAGLLDAKRYPAATLLHTEWNAISRIDVVDNTGSVSWTGANPLEQPPQTQIVIDGDAATPVIEYGGDPSRLAFLDRTIGAAAHLAFQPKRVLVIGAGGGVDVLTALRSGASSVDAVEVNPTTVRLMSTLLKARSSNLYDDPRVHLIEADGRAFVERTANTYDAIQISLVDTWAATSQNAYSLAESHLYTVEAFESYLRHLGTNGVLTMTRWSRAPPRETLRLCVVAARALEKGGYGDGADRVVVLGNGRLGNMLVKKTPFTPEELATLKRIGDVEGFHFVYAPNMVGENTYARFFRAASRSAFVASYPFDVSAISDDQPYFFQLQRWRDTRLTLHDPAMLSGRVVVVAVLVQSVVASIALLWIARDRKGTRGGWMPSLYFALIGFGFMFFEVALVQHATLLLGSATYALALALGTLLCAAGVGSLGAARVTTTPRRGVQALVLAGLTSIVAASLFHLLDERLLALPTSARVFGIVALAFPVAALMGMAFPSGVARLVPAGEHVESSLGRAWAINGCASVIGPILAALIAMDLGVTAVMLASGACYVLAAGAYVRASV